MIDSDEQMKKFQESIQIPIINGCQIVFKMTIIFFRFKLYQQ